MAKTQNTELCRGVNKLSSNALAKANGRFNFYGKGPQKNVEKKVETATKPNKWYPAEDIPSKLASAKTVRNSKRVAKLRSSIVPGTVLVLLSGRFRGKRVVFLKQLASGTLLVTGPYKINGVPLRRVNQAYVIATSTKVDLSSVSLPENLNDEYFAREKVSKKGDEEKFFAQSSTAAVVSEQRKKDQKAVDSALLKVIKKQEFLQSYLNAKFSLNKADRPHEMKF